MKRAVTMRKALSDPKLLGNALVGESWATWRIFLIACNGETLTDSEREVFKRFTGREREPGRRVEEALFVIGRRGGKDRAVSVWVTYQACLVDWTSVLAKGERGVALCLGPDQRQSKITRDYIEGVLDSSPLLSALVTNKTADTIELSNGISIEVRAVSFKRNRGMTCVAITVTEPAYLPTDEAANPDHELLTALRPSLSTTHGPLCLITTPYRRRGEVWNIYQHNFGPDGDPLVLVAQATSRDFNPTLSQRVIDRAVERDAAAARSEYFAEFRSDLSDFVSRAAVEGCVIPDRRELTPMHSAHYEAFCDPSGAARDAMVLSIGHRSSEGIPVLDVLRVRTPPFSPDQVTAEFAALLKVYGCHKIVGDKYGGEWPAERFKHYGIEYVAADRSKSDYYTDFLAILNSGRCELLDHPGLISQLCSLERRTARSGKDSIDHPPNQHDDIANATAGLLVGLASKVRPMIITAAMVNQIAAASGRYGGGFGGGTQWSDIGSMGRMRR
ncbi:MAG: hypothetical protein ACLQFW_15960 [Xanthobacteraceae bacterium]